MSVLSERLASVRAEGRAALVGYLPAGFPSLDVSVEAMRAMVDNGVDIVEVGLPYSDPLMDGPTIERAVDLALRAGTTTSDVFGVVERVASSGAPTLVMTYWNPVARRGVEEFAARLAASGGAGLITPDIIPEEAGEWLAASDAHGLDRIFLVAPSSTDERLRLTTRACRGFVYAASVMGVTGTRARASAVAPTLVGRVRAVTSLPVCVGLGVSTPEQATEVAGYADGVIVGSAFVRALSEAPDPHAGVTACGRLAARLAAAVRSAPGAAASGVVAEESRR